MYTVGIAGIGRRGSAGAAKGRAHGSFQRRIIGIMIGRRLVMGGKGKHNNVSDRFSKRGSAYVISLMAKIVIHSSHAVRGGRE